eukprot:354768-Chlamydomonas_euryale.AAC.1
MTCTGMRDVCMRSDRHVKAARRALKRWDARVMHAVGDLAMRVAEACGALRGCAGHEHVLVF